MFRRKRVLIAAFAVAAAIVAAATIYVVRGNIFDPLNRGRSVVSGEFVGQTRTTIEAKYGPPTNECKGHYGNPGYEYEKQHDPAITVTYVRGGGTLYLSFERNKQGEWVCFSSHWMPNGAVF